MNDLYVYILSCSDNSYYTGVTSDLSRRFAEHQAGLGGAYTAARRPVTMVFSHRFEIPEQAIAAEKQIKGWSRKKKEALMAGNMEELHELAKCRRSSGSMGMTGVK